MTESCMKRCSTSPNFRKLQIKTTMKCHLTSVRRSITQKTRRSKCLRVCREKEFLEDSGKKHIWDSMMSSRVMNPCKVRFTKRIIIMK